MSILNLPVELHLIIISHLSDRTKRELMKTCKYFSSLGPLIKFYLPPINTLDDFKAHINKYSQEQFHRLMLHPPGKIDLFMELIASGENINYKLCTRILKYTTSLLQVLDIFKYVRDRCNIDEYNYFIVNQTLYLSKNREYFENFHALGLNFEPPSLRTNYTLPFNKCACYHMVLSGVKASTIFYNCNNFIKCSSHRRNMEKAAFVSGREDLVEVLIAPPSRRDMFGKGILRHINNITSININMIKLFIKYYPVIDFDDYENLAPIAKHIYPQALMKNYLYGTKEENLNAQLIKSIVKRQFEFCVPPIKSYVHLVEYIQRRLPSPIPLPVVFHNKKAIEEIYYFYSIGYTEPNIMSLLHTYMRNSRIICSRVKNGLIICPDGVKEIVVFSGTFMYCIKCWHYMNCNKNGYCDDCYDDTERKKTIHTQIDRCGNTVAYVEFPCSFIFKGHSAYCHLYMGSSINGKTKYTYYAIDYADMSI